MTRVTNQTKLTTGSAENTDDGSWTVASAKAHFSNVLERARVHGPQTITRHGRPMAVIVAAEEWERKTRRTGSLADFFASSPLRGADDLVVEREADLPRDSVE
jgi:prevent-host-death family protein